MQTDYIYYICIIKEIFRTNILFEAKFITAAFLKIISYVKQSL